MAGESEGDGERGMSFGGMPRTRIEEAECGCKIPVLYGHGSRCQEKKMNLNEYQKRASEGGHSLDSSRPCPECGDLDGCHLPGKLTSNRLSFEEFWPAQAAWSQKTFGADSVRGPEGPLKHLKKEVDEALKKPDDIMEYADMIFLTMDSCRRAGFTCEQLRIAINEKLKINIARRWSPASATEPVEHVRE